MATENHLLGKRFSSLYLEKGTPLKDSTRFRIRLARLVENPFAKSSAEGIRNLFERELGVLVPYRQNNAWMLEFYRKAEIRDVLDSITLLSITKFDFDFGQNKRTPGDNSRIFNSGVNRIFREENISYTVDDSGGVHFFQDQEFEKNRSSTLTCLENPRYQAIKVEFENAFSKLDREPVDTDGAIFSIFKSLEIIYKLMVVSTKNDRLTANNVNSKIVPIIEKIYSSNETAKSAGKKLAHSFGDWIDGCHMYRHGQENEHAITAPLDLAVVIISQGASFLRWLAEIDVLFKNEEKHAE